MIWLAPAKLNLFLHIVGRRPDGFHLLQTAIQFLDRCDELRFRITDDGRISRATELPGVPASADLTLRAARLLQRHAGVTPGVEIAVHKHVPIGGGLGGGSSDAATTLMALNRLWGVGLGTVELAALGLQLGADVPVFIHGRAALAQGVGELLTPLELPTSWYLVVVPPARVPTAEIYAAYAAARGLTPYTAARTIRDLQQGHSGNDLERIVRTRYPAVDSAFGWLAPHGRPRMTGSGGCVFLELESAERGERLLTELPAGFDGFVARGMNRHPVQRAQARRQTAED